MIKLYALEDDSVKNNELLIDKLLEANKKKEESPISLTADIIKQRQQLKEKVLDKLEDSDKEEDSSKEESKEGDTSSEESKEEEISKEETEGKEDTSNEESKEENASSEEPKEEETSKEETENKEDTSLEEDISSASEDKESLKGLVGSGLKENKSEKESKPKEATESLFIKPKLTLNNIFKPIQDSYIKYRMSLESFNVPYKLAIEEQPIVYVKDSIKEALDNLIQLSNNYITSNTSFINNISQSVKSLNERFTIITHYVNEEKFHFTQKLINDRDILSNLSIPNNSDIRATIKVLLSYIDNSTKIVTLILNNSFDKLKSSYTTNNFEEVEDDLSYKSILPGFNLIKVHIDPYNNYLNTKIQNYQYYKLKVFKTEDMFSLNAITINDDNDINYILNTANKLIGHIGLIVDNLTLINNNFNKFIDEIKVMSYNIDKDLDGTKSKNLANIGIDDKVKDFIKFKLVIEECVIDINIIIEYLTSLETVINSCVELKD